MIPTSEIVKVLAEGWTLSCAGDAALVVECKQEIDPNFNARVLRIANALRKRDHKGIHDIVGSYCAITIHFDPLRTNIEQMKTEIQAEVERVHRIPGDPTKGQRRFTIPVLYGDEYGPDLAAIAAHARCGEAEVVKIHTSQVYRVYMLGFLPGFAYMGSVPLALAMPRRRFPRLKVPTGSVGIAGRQTGVYPLAAPGGWQLIGRTPLQLFDLGRAEPFLFRPGDSVRFEAVSSSRFDELRPKD